MFWLALLLCLPQALYVRARAVRFGPAQGKPSGVEGKNCVGRALRVQGVGDSIIAGVGVGRYEHSVTACIARELARHAGSPVQWAALGESGADSRRVKALFDSSLPAKPADLVVVSAGVNDTTGLRPLRGWQRSLMQLLKAVHRHSPDAQVLLLGLPPMHHFPLLPRPLRWLMGLRSWQLDSVAAEVAAQYSWLTHVVFAERPAPDQFSDDGYHPSVATTGHISNKLLAALPEQWWQGLEANHGKDRDKALNERTENEAAKTG